MQDTKERILTVSLDMFSKRGYGGVSLSDIADKIGITKAAIYKHYNSKRDIFDSILKRMEEKDRAQAKDGGVPKDPIEKSGAEYSEVTAEELISFSRIMLDYWTCDPFASAFRRMISIEALNGGEAAKIYGQYLVDGPLSYIRNILSAWDVADPEGLALDLYGGMFYFYSEYDIASDKEAVRIAAERHFEKMRMRIEKVIKGDFK